MTLTPLASGYQIGEEVFDQVILATGAWLGHLLEPLGYEVDVRPQKGNSEIINLPKTWKLTLLLCQKRSGI